MKRLLTRLSILTGVAILGFFAIAQAQRGSDEPTPQPVEQGSAPAPHAAGADGSDASPQGQYDWPSANAATAQPPRELASDAGRQQQLAWPPQHPGAAAASPTDGRDTSDPFSNPPPSGRAGPPASDPNAQSWGTQGAQASTPSTAPANVLRRQSGSPQDEYPLRHDEAAPEPAAAPYASPALSPQGSLENNAIGSTSRGALPGPADFSSSPGGVAGEPHRFPGDLASSREPFGELSASTAPREGAALPGDRQLEGGQLPALKIQKFAPGEVHVNKPATFEVHVRNTGEVPARDVEVHDRVPKGTQFVSSMPATEPMRDGRLVWRYDTLAPGEKQVIKVQLRPLTTGEIGSVATVRFSADASVRTRCTCPELRLEVSANRQTLIGDSMALDITVTNVGDGPATGVVLAEQIPAQFQHAQGPVLENDLGTLAPGQSRRIKLTLKAVKSGRVMNHLIVRGDGDVRVEKRTELEVVAPELVLDVRGPRHRYLERPATYTIAVQNPGTAAAKTVQLTAHVPRGFRFLGANHFGEYDPKVRQVAWERGELQPGERAAVELKLMPVEPGTHPLQVNGIAMRNVTASHNKPVRIEGVAAVQFTVLDTADPLEAGSETKYEVRVVNQGSKAATDVSLVAEFPPGLQPVSGSGPVQAQIQGNGVVFARLARLAPRADTTFYVHARGTSAGDHRVRFQLSTAELQSPVTKEESTRVFADQ